MIVQRDTTGPDTLLHSALMLLCLASGLTFSTPAQAADACTGWGGETTKTLDLKLPATLDLTVNNSMANAVLSSGSVSLPPLSCENGSQQAYTRTSVNWLTGGPGAPDVRQVAPGLGLRLKYMAAGGMTGTLPSINADGNETNGLNWTTLNWELIRMSDTAMPGTLPSASLARISLGNMVDGNTPTLNLISGNPVTVSAACTLSVDKSLVILPDTSTLTMMKTGYSDSVPLTAGVTCPGNTRIGSGTTLTMGTAQADATNIALVGNTGTATGVGIEVLDSDGNRVSASGGSVRQEGFTQNDTGMPGATEVFDVRMVRHPEEKVRAGTIRGTFTLTLTVN